MSALGKEDPLLEIDSQPFLATSYDDAMKLYQASKPAIIKGLDQKGLVFLYAVPWPCLLYTSPSPRDKRQSRMPSSA